MILAFTGAGISKDSGIGTFMENPQVRDKLYRTFAQQYPQIYRDTILQLYQSIEGAEPNDAHYALYDYGIDVITMNIDGLHELAGSNPITLHGTMPSEDELAYADTLWNKPVLYGDPAPNYQKALHKVNDLKEGDILLIVGASHHTGIAVEIREIAYHNGVDIIEIQDNAVEEVRKTLDNFKEKGRL